jgi:Leucine-rich repeat (LRR) protein
MKSLVEVDLSSNRLQDLPPEVGCWEKLEKFSACDTLITELPEVKFLLFFLNPFFFICN